MVRKLANDVAFLYVASLRSISLALFPPLRYNTAHKALTEESSPGKPDREAGTQTEIPARQEAVEVPS